MEIEKVRETAKLFLSQLKNPIPNTACQCWGPSPAGLSQGKRDDKAGLQSTSHFQGLLAPSIPLNMENDSVHLGSLRIQEQRSVQLMNNQLNEAGNSSGLELWRIGTSFVMRSIKSPNCITTVLAKFASALILYSMYIPFSS